MCKGFTHNGKGDPLPREICNHAGLGKPFRCRKILSQVRQNIIGQQASRSKSGPLDARGAFGGFSTALRLVFRARNIREIPRLLREGPKPVINLIVQAHNTMAINRLLRENWQLNFVSSFPRSGNTWVRHLLADVFLQCHGMETATELPIHPDKIIPDFYCHWIARRDVTIPMPGVFVKSHETFQQLQSKFGALPAFRACKHIYLYRSPEDALVSLFHYHDKQKHLKSKAAGGIDAFCRKWLPSWEENLASYLGAAEEGYQVLFVPYELLLQYPVELLSSLLRWLGARNDGVIVERAISNMQFSKLQAAETRNCVSEEAFFFRKGCKGAGRTELQAATMEVIQERTAKLTERANARVLAQQSMQGSPVASRKTVQISRNPKAQGRLSGTLPAVAKMQKV